ncbi:glycoside hydrolase family 63 protein [Hydnum rufescens UP504]|uniref:Mannosyl-oligosaccharide glucosidase n=1 Tax=Hydnum rufescens UP504 TaxID=1448309 RepID=A0A9P6DY34_9AGAM|nr:glycoside hydrolase family 63 protein [Hydnum rufescens UP504]
MGIGEAYESNVDDKSLLWGTYRPNLYFGLRPRLPHTLMTGLMWHGLQDWQSFSRPRHACDQGDGLQGYTWTEHDLRNGGIQVLNDTQNNVQITTEWLKVPGKPLQLGLPSKTSVYFYFAMDGVGGLELENEEDDYGIEGTVNLSGTAPEIGDFSIRIQDGPDVTPISQGPQAAKFASKIGKTSFVGLPVGGGDAWKARDIILRTIVQAIRPMLEGYKLDDLPEPAFLLTLPNEVYGGSNFIAIQKAFEGPFSFDIYYDSASVKQRLDAEGLTRGIDAFRHTFTRRFLETFPLPPSTPNSLIEFSKSMTSNLLGGIGYFYGSSIVDASILHEWDDEESLETGETNQDEPTLIEPRGLLTATPSRSFFPRGFYWDEGFHLLIVGAWDNDLSLEILKEWIDLIDEDGWVGREQILGEEARSKVPKEFQTQYPTYANPPTLAMAVTAFIERLRASPSPFDEQLGVTPGAAQQPLSPSPHNRRLIDHSAASDYLRTIYPALRRHYHWFRRTQGGQIKQWGRHARSRTEAYRWRGRTVDHVLTSGLDDYPRATPPHVGELHLDLISWMAFFTRTMRGIAEFAGETDDEAEFREIEVGILQNIEDLHWSEESSMYCDASINEDEESYHVCHKGYISLFPFLLGLLTPDSPHLGAILDLVRSPDELWSPYGIRSLSASHPLFGQGENYWRGPIWVQMNYLALSALYKTYIPQSGPYQQQARQIYDELRQNIIGNVFKEYERTGYVWEQYDALTGEGKRSHPFTGWTSLVTLIQEDAADGMSIVPVMSEKY